MTDHTTSPTNQQLDEIAARHEAATEGPWEAVDATDSCTTLIRARSRAVGRVSSVADAEFVAHAPADVDFLLAEVRRLRTRTLTEGEYDAAWHAVEGTAGAEGADPGTVLHAVLARLGIALPAPDGPAVVSAEATR